MRALYPSVRIDARPCSVPAGRPVGGWCRRVPSGTGGGLDRGRVDPAGRTNRHSSEVDGQLLRKGRAPLERPRRGRSTPRMTYRYFYDCEFIEDGVTIDLVSIGVVDESGRGFYAVSTEFDPDKAIPRVRRTVLDKPPAPAGPAWRSRERIRDGLSQFLVAPLRGRSQVRMELWAW